MIAARVGNRKGLDEADKVWIERLLPIGASRGPSRHSRT